MGSWSGWTRTVRLVAPALVVSALFSALPVGPTASNGVAGAAGAAVSHSAGGVTTDTTDDFWLTTASGNVYPFGVPSYGTPAGPLNKSIVALVPTADTHGYWLVATDGGVFAFGDAEFYGSTGALTLNKPIVGMASTPDGGGYWLVATDGGVFAFGDAEFYGSTAAAPEDPVEQVVATKTGNGYWIVQQDGTATPFGDAGTSAPPPVGLLFTAATPGDSAVLFAFQQLGKPYIWGGNGPVGYDCSGLALAAWTHGSSITFARVADDQYHTAGTAVPMNALRAGDLVFWGTNSSDWTTVYHTAIYVGGNQIVEATGNQVQLNTLGQWGTGDLMPNGRRP